jgi:hypothetical protein
MEFKELVQRIYYFDHFNQFGSRDPNQHKINKENLVKFIAEQKLTKTQKDKIMMECGKLFDEHYKWAKGCYPNQTKQQPLWNQGRGPKLKSVIKGYLK